MKTKNGLTVATTISPFVRYPSKRITDIKKSSPKSNFRIFLRTKSETLNLYSNPHLSIFPKLCRLQANTRTHIRVHPGRTSF